MLLTTALSCLALNIYHEGRGESDLGMKLIAQTTMNRAKGKHGNVCAEVLKPKQFSWTSKYMSGKSVLPHGRPTDQKSWAKSQRIAQQALNGSMKVPEKYTYVTHFHNSSAKPNWTKSLNKAGRVGGHHFYTPLKIPKM